jgi:hypothetical protein
MEPRNQRKQPSLPVMQVIKWATAHRERTGAWPSVAAIATGTSGDSPMSSRNGGNGEATPDMAHVVRIPQTEFGP